MAAARANSKTVEQRRERVRKILPILRKSYPEAKCSLDYANPLELLVATILSAQCTDERVNLVTKTLFRKYRSAKDYAGVALEELEKDIQSTGFYRNKAKSLKGMGHALVERHGGKVPATMDELVELPGVGRKTANVVLGNAFGKNVGVVVDTHVGRLSERLGLTKEKDPVKVEADLAEVVPQDEWTMWAHLMIAHGRKICQARKPRCQECPLLAYCPAGEKLVKAATS
jgi:endonuclease-3